MVNHIFNFFGNAKHPELVYVQFELISTALSWLTHLRRGEFLAIPSKKKP